MIKTFRISIFVLRICFSKKSATGCLPLILLPLLPFPEQLLLLLLLPMMMKPGLPLLMPEGMKGQKQQPELLPALPVPPPATPLLKQTLEEELKAGMALEIRLDMPELTMAVILK